MRNIDDTAVIQDESTRDEVIRLVPVKLSDSTQPESDRIKSTDDLVKFEFSITGMTCVNCSGTIEKLMHTEFDSKKMKECQIALLTHKMNLTFAASVFLSKEVTPEMICDEVEMIGFGCELLNMLEMNEKDHSSVKKRKNYDKALESE